MAIEKYVYIHGVVSDRTRTKSHDEDYGNLRNGLHAILVERGAPLPPLDTSVTIEWGWETGEAGDTSKLATAQRAIAERVDAATPRDRPGFTSLVWAPAITPVRNLVTLGWADIVYYVGKGGKRLVRSLVWNQIISDVGPQTEVDLTVVGHSAGALVAHDFLFWLYSGERDDEMGGPDLPSRLDFEAARTNWRLRRLVTLGAPVAPLLVRSSDVTEILADPTAPLLDAAKIGLGQTAHSGDLPKWLNVWDRHDVLSYPVQPFYDSDRVVDLYPDHSDSLVDAHDAYWNSSKVHRALADSW